MKSVKNHVALVTGANRGIGKSIVEEFLREGATKVYAAARNLESLNSLVSQYGERVVPLHVDLNDPSSIDKAAAIASDAEIVVNNAGMLNVANPLAGDVIDALQEEMEVNVYGLIRVAKAFAPILEQNGGGALVQLNSVASIKSFADFSSYSASKAASYSMTQSLRDVLKQQGTQVISVHPGPIATDMAKEAGLADFAEPVELVPQAIIHAIASGDFHAFPDSMARQVGEAYNSYATGVVEANLMEG